MAVLRERDGVLAKFVLRAVKYYVGLRKWKMSLCRGMTNRGPLQTADYISAAVVVPGDTAVAAVAGVVLAG